MMFLHEKKIILCIIFLLLSFTSSQASQITTTQPNIVVSIEPLYELVSSLSHGVVKPEVIYMNFNDIEQPLSPEQTRIINNADIIIRAGKGFEPLLDDYIQQQGEVLKNKTITLSKYIPLLDRETAQGLKKEQVYFIDRQANSDLRFWMDPRLLKMLVTFIGPKLVYMDPEHQEAYLDNEILVKAQLKKIEQKMLSLFNQLSREQKFLMAQFNPYLKNRYLSFAEIKDMDSSAFAQTGVTGCIQNHSFKGIPLNLEYTEKALNSLMHTLELCTKSQIVGRQRLAF